MTSPQPPKTTAGQQVIAPEPIGVEALTRELKRVTRAGLRAACLANLPRLLRLTCVTARAHSPNRYDRAIALEHVLLQAIEQLGTGPYGQAARVLFGCAPGTRGLPLKHRRRQAARELDIEPATFRKHREPTLLLDLAVELYKIEQEALTTMSDNRESSL